MKNQLENNGSYLGFTDNKTALQKAKIESCLDKVFRYSNGIMARKDAILYGLRNGKKPEVADEVRGNGTVKKSYRMAWDNLYNDITKTEYDFCIYLIEHDLVSEESVNAFIEAENKEKERAAEEQRKVEEAARKEEERAEVEKEEFKIWLAETSKMYNGTTRGNLVERIYLDVYGEFRFPLRAFELLVCIDNIEKSLCREELKARLHTGNKASRKVFQCVTGLKLPNTNRDTMAFLDSVQKSDYQDAVEYKTRKKPEKQPETEKEKFYVLMSTEKGKKEYVPAMGSKIEKHGVEMFIHETPDGKIAISSIKCGLRMATGKSKTEAIKEMKELFKKMDIDTINSRIDEITSYYGVSPYLKQA